MNWLSDYTLMVTMLAALSVAMLTVSIVAAPWAVARLPSDYLLNRLNRPAQPRSASSMMIFGLRALVGLILVTLGLIMLITPGPGVIMLLLGVSIAEFPGRNRLLVHLATRPRVLSSLNWMRERHGKPPFVPPS